MDVWEAVRVVGRHWLVVAIGMLLAAFATVRTYTSVEPSYEAHGSAIVIPATATVDKETQRVIDNPYGGERQLVGAAQLAGEIGRGDDVAELVKAQGGTAEYVVDVPDLAPIINVAATGASAPVTVATVNGVLTALSSELARRQADTGVPEPSRLVVDVISQPVKADVVNASRVKSTGLIAVLGIIAAVSLAFLAEAITGGTRRRTSEAPTGGRAAMVADGVPGAPRSASPGREPVRAERFARPRVPGAKAP